MKKSQKKYSSSKKNFTKKFNKYTQQGGDGDLKGSEYYNNFIETRIKFFEPELDLSGEENNILGAINEGYQKAQTGFQDFTTINQYETKNNLKYQLFLEKLETVTTDNSYISFAMVHGEIDDNEEITFQIVPENTMICFISPPDKLTGENLASDFNFNSEFNELTQDKYLKFFQDNMKLRNEIIETDRELGISNVLLESMWYFPGQVYPEVEMTCNLDEMETSPRDDWGFKFLGFKKSDPIVSDHPDPSGEFLDKNNLISKLKTDFGKPNSWISYLSNLVNHHHTVLNPAKDKIKLVFTICCRPINSNYGINMVKQIFLTEMYFMEYNRKEIFNNKKTEYSKPLDSTRSLFVGKFSFDSHKLYLLKENDFDDLKGNIDIRNHNLSGQVPTLQRLFGDSNDPKQFIDYFINGTENELIDNYIYITNFSLHKILKLFTKISRYTGGQQAEYFEKFCHNLIKYGYDYLEYNIQKIFESSYYHVNYLTGSNQKYHEEITDLLDDIYTFGDTLESNSGFNQLFLSKYINKFKIDASQNLGNSRMLIFINGKLKRIPGTLILHNVNTLYLQDNTNETVIIEKLGESKYNNPHIENLILACDNLLTYTVGSFFGNIKKVVVLHHKGRLNIANLFRYCAKLEDLQIKFPMDTPNLLINRTVNTSLKFLKLENTGYYFKDYYKFVRLIKLELIKLKLPASAELQLKKNIFLKEIIIKDCDFSKIEIENNSLDLLEINNPNNLNIEINLKGFCETLILENIGTYKVDLDINFNFNMKINTCIIIRCMIKDIFVKNFLNFRKTKTKKYPNNSFIIKFTTFYSILDTEIGNLKQTILNNCKSFKNVHLEMLFVSSVDSSGSRGTNPFLQFTPEDFKKLSIKKFNSFSMSKYNLDVPAITEQRDLLFLNRPNFNIIN